jgi:hypothetical protein
MIEIIGGILIVLLILLNIRFRNLLKDARDTSLKLLEQLEESKKQVIELHKQNSLLMGENVKLKSK